MIKLKNQEAYGMIIDMNGLEGFGDYLMGVLMSLGLGIFGAVMGSFVCCQIVRLNRREEGGEKLGKMSECLSCKSRIKWYDNIPIVSWLILKGRCRSCGKKIGSLEIWAEVGGFVGFVVMGMFNFGVLNPKCGMTGMSCEQYWSGQGNFVIEIMLFLILLVAMCGMTGLLIYDAKWQRLPVFLLTFLNICAIIYRLVYVGGEFLRGVKSEVILEDIGSMLAGVGILAGVYFVLYKFSKEKWVGGGDYLLALPLAVILGSWWLALVTMFVANLLATLVMWPSRKKNGGRIAFGPFLIVGFLIVFVLQDFLKLLMMGLG